MPVQSQSRIIVDTNLWISFLIGKELQYLRNLIVDQSVKLVMSDQLFAELQLVTSRKKLEKYFDQSNVEDLIALLNHVSLNVKIKKIERVCRDPKDDFLLALSKASKADFLITGDKDLLEIGMYGKTEILSLMKFRRKFEL